MTDKDVARKRKRFYDALSAAAALKISFEPLYGASGRQCGIGDFLELGGAFATNTRDTLKRELIESWDEWQHAKAYVDAKAEGYDDNHARLWAKAYVDVKTTKGYDDNHARLWAKAYVDAKAKGYNDSYATEYAGRYVRAKAEGHDDSEAQRRAEERC